jgi:hypothetical protein
MSVFSVILVILVVAVKSVVAVTTAPVPSRRRTMPHPPPSAAWIEYRLAPQPISSWRFHDLESHSSGDVTRVALYSFHDMRAQMTRTLSVRIDRDTKDQLEALVASRVLKNALRLLQARAFCCIDLGTTLQRWD